MEDIYGNRKKEDSKLFDTIYEVSIFLRQKHENHITETKKGLITTIYGTEIR